MRPLAPSSNAPDPVKSVKDGPVRLDLCRTWAQSIRTGSTGMSVMPCERRIDRTDLVLDRAPSNAVSR